jgi:glycine hydroxymethyltransferase
MLNLKNLKKTDPEIRAWILKEVSRQAGGFELIASENIASPAVLEAMGTPLTNKYSEGYPGKRYYGGNECIDGIESLAIERAKKLFNAEHANVQPHSGSQANQAAYMALAAPGDTILAMNLSHGGHLTHGAPFNFSGKIYRFVHYGVKPETQIVDMDQVRALAHEHKPKIIVAGFSAYPRHLDFAAFRRIADEVGAKLVVDMAHFAGLVAAKLHPDPVAFADVVTTTTHKTLRGPRGGMILCRAEFAKAIDAAVFPGCQGGPLDHVVAAKAVALHEASLPSFIDYQKQTLANARALAQTLIEEKIKLVTDGTDNHLVLADVSAYSGGLAAEKNLDRAGIYANKNMIPFDARKPGDPSGVRLGTPAATTRGLKEKEIVELGKAIAAVIKNPTDEVIKEVRGAVKAMAEKFPLPY